MNEDERMVRREIVLPAERDAVWAFVGEPDGLSAWLADEVDLDAVEPGAEGTLRWADGTTRTAVVEDVEPGRRISLCWWEQDDGERTLVDLTLDDAEDGTRLVVVEVPLQTVRAVSAALAGTGTGARGPRMLALA